MSCLQHGPGGVILYNPCMDVTCAHGRGESSLFLLLVELTNAASSQYYSCIVMLGLHMKSIL